MIQKINLNQIKKSPGQSQKAATTAHLIETTAHQLAHTKRHFDQLKKDKTNGQKKLDYEHAATHLNGGIEHVQKLLVHLKSNYPKEGKELSMLENTVAQSGTASPKTKAKIKGIADALKKG